MGLETGHEGYLTEAGHKGYTKGVSLFEDGLDGGGIVLCEPESDDGGDEL